ncbi:SDR family NAD(P)-dependent oxidoreductase [Subtercola frigoramans]|uniref:NAD(P)-dependent dehydrogenase (Short-subunit alcohol dehydrogenase family) n=1 Tax=Subtercola frigoramans TaxID=120298 RepID=A0ABS2L6I8_9MICO|nr:SDR family NAD(P)-dependent oxidoreductase [Subtercola frigoramans]MBM7472668.1 NAD(P)-dependent dehydrogenase (short-subunit alcohol dehydrogenase family) [Subtercola frigoramans]
MSQDTPEPAAQPAIDPAELEVALRVLASLHELDEEHPDFVAVRRATAKMFKSVKKSRRDEKREAIQAADKSVIAGTATGAPDRIDDETRGVTLAAITSAPSAGTLIKSRPCYICKQHYTQVDAFYHQLCPDCALMSHAKRDARTDLNGKRALLTGGRAKIGMYIALRLLRDGAHTTITTRFPRDAVRRFSSLPDSGDWLHRLRVVGIDLRDPAQVIGLAETVAAAGPLDILINNAAQTVKRSPGSYAPLAEAELAPLPEGPKPEMITFGHTNDAHPQALAASVAAHPLLQRAARAGGAASDANANAELAGSKLLGMALLEAGLTPGELSADELSGLALAAGSSSLERLAAGTAIDAGGLVPDVHHENSWTQAVHDVDPLEMLEVQLCNTTAPFLLISKLRASMAEAAAAARSGRAYVVNVSAMEGVFARGYKGPGHPHTNMAKAALNMLTRTSAKEMFATDGILMTSVDTGWITDERPHPTKVRLAEEGFHAPLDLVDGAARVYDPVVRGEAGEDLCGVFLKDYSPSPW